MLLTRNVSCLRASTQPGLEGVYNLAKVGVVGSNPIARSNKIKYSSQSRKLRFWAWVTQG